MSKGKKKALPESASPNIRHCTLCNVKVNLGNGGEANWQNHLDSGTHLRIAESVKDTNPLTSFFNAAPRPSTSKSRVRLSPPRISGELRFSEPPNTSTLTDFERPSPSSLFIRLQNTIKSLPKAVPVGSLQDDLARFSSDPSLELDNGGDAFEMVDKALNRVIGYGVTVDEISGLIRRGKFGMDGVYQWLESCVSKLRIDEVLLESKINRLIDAMSTLGASENTAQPNSSSTTVASPDKKVVPPKVEVPCPGYTLTFPENQTGWGSYPWLIHTFHNVPWSVASSGNSLILRSLKPPCTGASPSSDSAKPRPCISCRLLDNHDILLGVRDRAANGAKDKTRFGYLGPAHMIQSLEKKNEIINTLKLKVLNISRMLGLRNKHIDAWKRLSIAIGTENIPRIQSVIAAAHRAGASVFSMLDRVKKAAERTYRAKGFVNVDYQLLYLFYKVGGRKTADIAHNVLGLPSIDTAKRHVGTTPLVSSPKFPTLSELRRNVTTCFVGLSPRVRPLELQVHRIRGMSIQVDEIKIQERLRWDHHTNQILGVCREHTVDTECRLSLDFVSMNQADALLEALKLGKVHLATEATVIGASVFSDDPADYSTRAFAISGSCKRETYVEQDRLLRVAINSLKVNGLDDTRLYCISSDGDSRRRRALMGITMDRNLDHSSPIYEALSQLPLFNLMCGADDITCDFDWKHVFKRFRNTLLRLSGFQVDEELCTTSVIKLHLVQAGMDPWIADTLLAPNDRHFILYRCCACS